LRHVSEAFAEDPVRILRVARFASRFDDFNVHPETLALMRSIVNSGEVNALVQERVWRELERTLELPSPQRFFEVLQECGALAVIFPEIDIYSKTAINVLQHAATLSKKNTVKFAALTKCLSLDAIKTLCSRVRVPSHYRELALLVVRYQDDFSNILSLDAEGLLCLLEKLDAFRRPIRFVDFLATNDAADNQDQSLQSKKLMRAYNATANISTQALVDRGLRGEEIKHELHALRCKAITAALF
jgi:tRNA nucleotidyltransferase (CCA-adding enzyme)